MSLACSGYDGITDIAIGEQYRTLHGFFSWCFCPANSFIVALIYVVVGKILAENIWENWWISSSKAKMIVLWFSIFIVGCIEVSLLKWSQWINDAWLFLPPLTMLGVMILLRTDVNIEPEVARMMRNMSILIYILHPIMQYVNMKMLGMANGGLMFLVSVFECLLFSFLIIRLSEKVDYLKRLF